MNTESPAPIPAADNGQESPGSESETSGTSTENSEESDQGPVLTGGPTAFKSPSPSGLPIAL